MISIRNWWLISLKGLIFIFLGMYIFKFPVSGMLGLLIYGGISLFISGIIIAIYAFSTRHQNTGWGWQLGEGLLDILIAVILLSNLGLTVITLPYVFALYGIITGIFWIIQSTFFRRKGFSFWNIVLIGGLLSLIIGLLIFFHPIIAAITIVGIIGALFIVHGIFLLLFSFLVKRIKTENNKKIF
jgi:uncharacterized membrane protein HdeD (DUF308 family)